MSRSEIKRALKQALEESTGLPLEENVPLSAHTSFGIGGPAALFAVATTAEALGRLIAAAQRHHIDVLVMGGGTNLLVSDDGFEGLAIRLAMDRFKIDDASGEVYAEAGLPTARLVDETVAHGLGGLAFAAGLPGTIGGALAGNAGCFGHCLSDPLREATLVTPTGEVIRVKDKAWFQFQYRQSNLSRTGHILAHATFELFPVLRERVKEEAAHNIDIRRERHPAKGTLTAGSYFKNLPPLTQGGKRRAAGALLDRVGAKALSVGDAAVFEKHANIIVNQGSATARDVLRLAREMQQRVNERFGVMLEPEVRFVGPKPEGL